MPTVKQFVSILPETATVLLFLGWDVIPYNRNSALDAAMYGNCKVTECAQFGHNSEKYSLDIRFS